MQGLAADGVREGQGKGVQRLPVDQIGDDLLAALAARRAILGSGSAPEVSLGELEIFSTIDTSKVEVRLNVV